MKKKPQLTFLTVALALTGLSHHASAAAVILIDFGAGGSTAATLADFTTWGVNENISGSSIERIGNIQNSSVVNITGGGVAHYNWQPNSNGNIVNDGIHFNDRTSRQVEISGINLVAGNDYTLYIWGTNGDRGGATGNGQESEFVFNGQTQVSNANGTSISFNFSVGDAGVTENSVTFDWNWSDNAMDSDFAVMNAIAITMVPEPTSTVLLVLGALGFLSRRQR